MWHRYCTVSKRTRNTHSILFWRHFFQTAEERSAFKFNNETHLQPILTFLETTLNKVHTVSIRLCDLILPPSWKNIFPFPLATAEWIPFQAMACWIVNVLPTVPRTFFQIVFAVLFYIRFCNRLGHDDIVWLSSYRYYPYWQRQITCWRERVAGRS